MTDTNTMELADIDPRTLIVDKNVRTKLGDLAPLTASIKQYGVLQPLLVIAENGSFRVVAGGRRRAAAIKADRPTVPCLVRTGIDTEQALLEAQLIENLAREDLGGSDIAKGFEQLAAFGLDEAAIAVLTTRTVEDVNRGIAVAGSTPAKKAMKEHDLTLEQGAAIAELADVPGALSDLLSCASEDPYDFEHSVTRWRSKRDNLAKLDTFKAELTEKGVTISDAKPSYDRRLNELADGKGKNLTPTTHAKCPGHYAYLDTGGQFGSPEVIYACSDPDGNGHQRRNGYSSGRAGGSAIKTDAEKEAESEKRREVLANNKAWRAAEEVRRSFVRDLVKRKTAKGVMRFVTEEIVGDPNSITAEEEALALVLGIDQPGVSDTVNATDNMAYGRLVGIRHARAEADVRLPMVLLVQIAAAREGSMSVQTWRNDNVHAKTKKSPARRWIDFLIANGYKQADVEALVR